MEANKVELKVYNSMTQQKEVFKPIEPGKVAMYVCGITAYDFSHLGHARAAVSFDILYRYLLHLGYEVTYVRNFTDVDDKIIKRANEHGENPLDLSNRYCEEYLIDMGALQCLVPTHQPCVSSHMEQIIEMIEKIIEKDCGYVVDGDVFFSVDKSPNYGQLSGQKLEHTRAGERVAVDSRKRNPADFALWKAAKPGEPHWESPWGLGRPGWHIECSAMSAHYLSPRFDIHGGGIDLIFPHHENEIAQSCAACENSGVAYWLHNGHVTNNNEKMSKSLGNFFTIRDITARYHPLALRHFLISVQYRSPLNYSLWQLESSSDALYYIYQTLQDLVDALLPYREAMSKDGGKAQLTSEAKDIMDKLKTEFEGKMSDDLNTAHILTGAFQDVLKFINSSLGKLKKMQQKQRMSLTLSLTEVEKAAREILDVLGLLSNLSYGEFLKELRQKALVRAGVEEEDISRMIEERTRARKNKEFERSDQIRAELTVKGIALMDVGRETVWRPCVPTKQEDEKPEIKEQPPAEQEKKSQPESS
ncbi:PREDICTED: cysteine--tRNA ligase 2, cytoplasmic-like [Tarenaya hassleriana]|uniref:cysteine--tRNA ligase 2, cytoplasmic-like n=1 Tax=Tarenaya hassleriana TaxID=28532 RepID=UPI00053C7543|nr:PREDICTED: cysteine--tRNA ligase 2, cytoplasmic-like [Tarenaya hassleriana]XP_010526148.1 PREDICTED: cysteine--tRNA ligase 2, cytoplasmic-like [Tarenaya hassleriana]